MEQAISKEKVDFQTDLSVGEILRRTRLHYDQSLMDIENALRIRSTLIEAIETGNYAALPGRVYTIGFIRSYSEYLGLDGEKMVQLFKKQSGVKTDNKPDLKLPASAAEPKIPQSWIVGISIAATILVLVVWMSMQGSSDRSIVEEVPPVPQSVKAEVDPEIPSPKSASSEEAKTAAADETEQPDIVSETATETPSEEDLAAAPEETPAVKETAEAEVAATKAPAADDVPTNAEEKGIILNITKNSWVEIRSKDGQSVVSKVLKAGDRYYVPDRPDLLMSLGNSGGVLLEVDGVKLKPLGAQSQVRRNIPLDAGYLKKKFAPGPNKVNE